MIIPYFSSTGSLDDLKQLVHHLSAQSNLDGIVILGCVDNEIDDTATDHYLTQLAVPVAGGLFPAIIHEQHVHQTGWLVYAIKGKLTVSCTQNISLNGRSDGKNAKASDPGMHADTDVKLVIVDGHASGISSFLTQVYSNSKVSTKFFGGGAGSLASTNRRCVISNAGLLRDAAVVLQLFTHSGIGVSHGWRATSPIMRATATSGNTVHELNFRPALDVYKEIIQSEFNAIIDPDDLIGTASMYPLGIRRIGGSIIVRDPIASTADGSLVCVGEFDENCFVYVLNSEMDALLASTASATQQAETDLGVTADHKIVFDCISRFLLMKDQFQDELNMLSGGDAPVGGVLSIGEIAGSSDGFLEFYNKTTAVAAFSGE
ncbi:MAG: FIST C-terminal domain-containing protein [Pseudohongiella sp.]|nr:FIST C-terminal domain-containing protein [Pseudohongiella sp.]